MYKMYLYSYFMVIVFLFWFVLGMFLYMMKVDLVVEWLIYSFNSFMVEMYLLIDWISCLFMGLVLIISSMVMLYSVGYMSGAVALDRFSWLVLLFIISMLMMILSPSLVSILFGWDLLGLVSYCLVIYYQNISAYNSGMITVLSNRVGDVGLLLSIGIVVMYGSWNMYMLNSNGLLMFMIMLAAITKSAQMPFSSWLLLAMAAPTPVSSLVHSSTLVTAGAYLIIRFNELMMMSEISVALLSVSVGTMFMAGLMASFEFDLKKIIALSTLSQLGLMMTILSLGGSILGFYHLLVHAVFKSLLFLCVGVIIHVMGDNQDIRGCGGQIEVLPFVTVSFYISVLSLVGFPFMSGFYSKDLIMESIYILELNVFLLTIVMISVVLTVLYSFRLCYYLGFFALSASFSMVSESNYMNFPMMILMMLSVVSGSLLNWCFFLELGIIFLPLSIKKLTLIMMSWGVVVFMFIKTVGGYLCIMKNVFLFNSSMWFLSLSYVGPVNFFILLGNYLRLVDMTWLETMSSSIWWELKMIVVNFFFMEFKVYNIILVIVIVLSGFMVLMI